MDEDFLKKKLDRRRADNTYRFLQTEAQGIDFCSNDYLGIVTNNILNDLKITGAAGKGMHGSTGSRLISGNYPLIEELEQKIAEFHQAEAGLLFNSGYDANLGLLSCVVGKNDTIIYDQFSHASIRDGIRLSNARAFSFRHNDVDDLKQKIARVSGKTFVVTESVFSMDGDLAPLKDISAICDAYGAHLVVDEAHATGVIGKRGEGLVQALELSQACFARMHSFGKALGCHGAIILGSKALREYLINFSRPFICTTAMPSTSAAAIGEAYSLFPGLEAERMHLQRLILLFNTQLNGNGHYTETPVRAVVIPGNDQCRKAAAKLQEQGFDVRPILSPTVPEGSERIRVALHAFNTVEEVTALTTCLNAQLQLTQIN